MSRTFNQLTNGKKPAHPERARVRAKRGDPAPTSLMDRLYAYPNKALVVAVPTRCDTRRGRDVRIEQSGVRNGVPIHKLVDPVLALDPTRGIGRTGFVDLALRVAREVAALVETADQSEFDTIVTAADEYVRAPRLGAIPRTLLLAARMFRKKPTLVIARAVARECLFLAEGADRSGNAARPAISIAHAFVSETYGASAAATLVSALIEEARRLDIIAHLEQNHLASRGRIERLIWRCDHIWLARLEGDTYGLLWRPADRCTWVEGPSSEVVACVPDIWFDQAVNAVRSV